MGGKVRRKEGKEMRGNPEGACTRLRMPLINE